MSSSMFDMRTLKIGSNVQCNWPNKHTGVVSVITGVVSSEPPLGQGATVDIKFPDGLHCGMKIVNRNSKKPGIFRADAKTLRSTMEMKEIANRGRTNINGLELKKDEVVVVRNPLNEDELYAVSIEFFERGRCFQGIYCCDKSCFDRFKIDGVVRKLEDGEDAVKFLENVEDKGESVGIFFENIIYTAPWKGRKLSVKVVEEDEEKGYYVRQCNAGGQLLNVKGWSATEKQINKKK